MASLVLNRRKILQILMSSGVTLASARPSFSADRRLAQQLGFNLIAWSETVLANSADWIAAVDNIHALGVNRITLVPFTLVNSKTGRLLERSAFGLVSGPPMPVIADVVAHARKKGMHVSLKPMIETDNREGEGAIFRGDLRFDRDRTEAFFNSYGEHILQMCQIAVENDATRFYIGTELVELVKDPNCLPYWLRLIEACRQKLGASQCMLTYAADFTEFDTIPFWHVLDEIGIDAYFPIATEQQASVIGGPSKSEIRPNLDKIFGDLRRLSEQHNKKLMLAEWGVVPLQLTTVDPSNHAPSDTPDVAEAVNAYNAILDVIEAETAPWLSGVDFWHWQVDPNEDSNYRIGSNGPIGQLLKGRLHS